ncbi:hypothetical protein ARMGADRAFT_1037022 [Armillaria gallica]|uniref:Uncharacterized protein n=1 Tax=Armillaria gallica TaxID=47427 RepID=A0A2H3CSW9_ARMGA|nr:hypothetical protein ARMGADRAFT_1037022 [Armillaria gallica]
MDEDWRQPSFGHSITTDPSFLLTSGYTLSTLRYTEKQLEWLETHVQPFEAAVIEGQHLAWLETFFVDWFKHWPEQDREEETCSACQQGILHRLTIQLGHGWCGKAGVEIEESIQIKIKLGVLDHLHQFIKKFAIGNDNNGEQ